MQKNTNRNQYKKDHHKRNTEPLNDTTIKSSYLIIYQLVVDPEFEVTGYEKNDWSLPMRATWVNPTPPKVLNNVNMKCNSWWTVNANTNFIFQKKIHNTEKKFFETSCFISQSTLTCHSKKANNIQLNLDTLKCVQFSNSYALGFFNCHHP